MRLWSRQLAENRGQSEISARLAGWGLTVLETGVRLGFLKGRRDASLPTEQ